MDYFRIKGGTPLKGIIPISGAKNSALKILAACLLTAEPLVISNVPKITDITTMMAILKQHGLTIEKNTPKSGEITVSGDITNTEAPYDIVSKMRASVLVLGPLLARCGEAKVSLPGGCAIGTRPVNLHLQGLEALGAKITLSNGYMLAHAPHGLKGTKITLPFASVGATENIMMAATLAKGTTEIINAAREPELIDLAHCLNKMGAQIENVGQGDIIVKGVDHLHGTHHRIMSDRIESGTYACAAAITGGDLIIEHANVEHIQAIIQALISAGTHVKPLEGDKLHVWRDKPLKSIDIITEPYPGFPTDMQAQLTALLSVAQGTSMITEKIFENRFMHVPELNRMGADIKIQGSSAIIRGVKRLTGAPVMATDLRASFSLILAALAAEGESTIRRIYHLDRGYEAVEQKLSACGAHIKRCREKSN